MENKELSVGDVARRTFGESVRKYRLANEWTQDTLARNVTKNGVNATQTMIAKIERGDRPTSISEAAVIAATFGIPVQALLPLDRESATQSQLGVLLSNFNSQLARLAMFRAQALNMEDALEDTLNEWDEYVRDLTPSERDHLAAVDIDARPSSENGMRDKLRGEHSKAR
ncbi:helix-turn-helix transcriptional regulator [Pseudarthrobacter sp. NS4]|uniref:helix-turn-helix transcriptional regulator n=1 Tax=Pseudarthrobacter sp. NS4 TaxID=2973976 RepID=UPI002162BB8B|nr:helix-turn-helix transcriptional regulator [Pseudarthrobacter sp. NS4]